MLAKIVFWFLLLKTLEAQFPIYELPKYGSKTSETPVGLYLSLDGFKAGDNIYLDLSYYNEIEFEYICIYYVESDDYLRSSFSFYTTECSYYTQVLGDLIVYSLSIKLEKDAKYLLIYVPIYKHNDNRVVYEMTLSHVKKSSAGIILKIIFIIFGVLIFLAIFIPILRCIIKRAKARKPQETIDYPKQDAPIQPSSENLGYIPPSY